MHEPINIVSYTLSCALGGGLDDIRAKLNSGEPTLSNSRYPNSALPTWVGLAPGAEAHSLPEALSEFDSRNNRLIDLALHKDQFADEVSALVKQLPAERVAVIMGSSTASMSASENALGNALTNNIASGSSALHTPHAPGRFVAKRLGILGPALTISTACSSSAKAFAMATRWLNAGLMDAVVVGGADSLSLGTLYGFDSLNLLSANPCKPFDLQRDGISVGEAAGFALLTRTSFSDSLPGSGLLLSGFGESSDAHHMSHPHPEGDGAIAAMQQAITMSGCTPNDIGYINLHGTATPTNDLVESQAVARVFNSDTLASSTKGWTGHTLGAAGITAGVLTLEALRTGQLPGTYNLEQADTAIEFPVMSSNVKRNIEHAMINTFGFGGSNCSLVFSHSRS